MKSLGCRPPISILSEMIDKGDSDRNGNVYIIMFIPNTFIKLMNACISSENNAGI